LTRELYSHIRSIGGIPKDTGKLKKYIGTLLEDGLGIYDYSEEEIQSFFDNIETALYVFADMVSRRAQIGWSTHGHSAVDVNIYGSAGSDDLRGNHENTDVGKFLRNYLRVSVDNVTKELNEALATASISTQPILTEDDIERALENHHLLKMPSL
jgi:alkaline phosphatase